MASVQKEPVILDLSVWNRSINAPVLKANAHAVILRCQYGTEEDRKFREFRQICEEHGIPWTPYLFWLAHVDPVKQIKLFMKLTGHWDVVNGKEVWYFDGKFGAWMDMEKGTRPATWTKNQLITAFEKFVKLFKQYTGLDIGIYTSKGWWDANMPDTDLPSHTPLLLWAAHWGVTDPLIPKDWIKKKRVFPYTLHQHSANGNRMASKFGIGSNDVDMNNYREGLQKFNQAYGLSLKPLSETKPPALSGSVIVNTRAYLNLRSEPSDASASTIIGSLKPGAVLCPDGVVVDSRGRSWYYIGAKRKLYFAAWLTRAA